MKSQQRIVAIITIILSLSIGYSKSLDKLYVSLLTEKGTVYHTYPMNLEYVKDKTNNLYVSPLKYDYTYIDSTDSVDVLMTVTYSKLSKPFDVSFNNSNKYPLSIIYIDSKGKNFVYRIKCTISYQAWVNMYSIGAPITVTLFCEDGINVQFQCPEKRWIEMCTDFTNLFKLIEKAK